MKRVKLSLWNDIVSFIAFFSLAATGLIMEFGFSERPRGPGARGEGAKELFLTMSRHDWGEVHFNIALVVIASIILHLFLHWNWIKAMLISRNRAQSIEA